MTRSGGLLVGMSSSLRSVREYCGETNSALSGRRVVVVAVYRDARRLTEGDLDPLRPDDVVEVAPILHEEAGRVRVAWITFGVPADSLSATRAWFEGSIPDGKLLPR